MVDLKTFLGLAISLTNCAYMLQSKDKKSQTFIIPIYSTTLLYDNIGDFINA